MVEKMLIWALRQRYGMEKGTAIFKGIQRRPEFVALVGTVEARLVSAAERAIRGEE